MRFWVFYSRNFCWLWLADRCLHSRVKYTKNFGSGGASESICSRMRGRGEWRALQKARLSSAARPSTKYYQIEMLYLLELRNKYYRSGRSSSSGAFEYIASFYTIRNLEKLHKINVCLTVNFKKKTKKCLDLLENPMGTKNHHIPTLL